ncbi:hypothetical protein MPER_10477, partial [Moniliophthora perniciosa FA553]
MHVKINPTCTSSSSAVNLGSNGSRARMKCLARIIIMDHLIFTAIGGFEHSRRHTIVLDQKQGGGWAVWIYTNERVCLRQTWSVGKVLVLKSRFCMHSFVRAQAGETVSLGYCPLDLFSPDEAHVRKAVHTLWDAWDASGGRVNNLKVFVKGRMLSVDETLPFFELSTACKRTLDMLDVEGLSKLWEKWHETTPRKRIPHIGQDTLEPTLYEWNKFIDEYLSQPSPASSPNGGEPTIPVIETENQLRKYLLGGIQK